MAKLRTFAPHLRPNAAYLFLERCRSGRSGRSRKPLYPLGIQGSNPCLSAKTNKQTLEIQELACFYINFLYGLSHSGAYTVALANGAATV